MMRAVHATFLFLTSALAMAADIRLPEPKTPDLPDPPTPGPISRLEANQLYVIESDKAILVLDSPQGRVKTTYSAGPVVVRARFVDGNGHETRVYKGPHVYMVEAAKSGKVELILVPAGAEKIEDVVRVSLDVDAGEGPRPPPKPDDPIVPPKPLPDGELGLIRASREGMAKVNSANRATEAKSLADAQRGLSSAIAAGAVPVNPATILDEWRKANNAAVNSVTWAEWGASVSARLSALHGEKKLPGRSEWAAAFQEIASGLDGGQ